MSYFNKTAKLNLLLLMGLVAGCAPGLNYNTLHNQIKSGNCELAVESIEAKKYGSNAKLNYLLDNAFVNMQCRNYELSNKFFHEAETLSDKLWTKSLTREAASFLINDYTIPYNGEDYERAFINLFSALNYLMLGNYEEAMVECRRLNSLLNALNDKYDKKSVYKEDAFGRYLSGMIYEAEGELDDAYIDYYNALQIYKTYNSDYGTPTPSILVEDLLRLAKRVDRVADAQKAISNPEAFRLSKMGDLKDKGKIVLIQLNGRSPVKVSDKVIIGANRGPITMAFPRYVVSQPQCRSSKLIVESSGKKRAFDSELAEDINEISLKGLDDRKGRVIVKTLARAVVKQAAINSITKDKTAQRLLNIMNTAIERADTRSWRTLPGEVYIARTFVPEGEYKVYASHCGEESHLKDFYLKSGETRFLLLDTIN